MDGKKRMRQGKFMAIMLPIIAVLVILTITVTVLMNYFSASLDTFLTRGEKHVVKVEGSEDWDTDYYNKLYGTEEEARDAAYEVAMRVQDEGTILLKNDGVLPLAKGAKVAPIGYAAKEPVYGQETNSGSAKWVIDPVTPVQGLSGQLTVNDAAIKAMPDEKPTELKEAEGTMTAGYTNSFRKTETSYIYEYPASVYAGIESQLADSVGVMFVSRSGSEGNDKKRDAYEDGTRHFLELTQNEKDTIRFAKRNCSKLVVVFVCSAPMELGVLQSGDLAADAILWYGHPSERGLAEIGKILTGEVNPSGRTVDIFPADFTKNPSLKNFGNFYYDNATFTMYAVGEDGSNPVAEGSKENYRTFVEYQEGVYMGYRYYETAAKEDAAFDYAKEVVYPFGYGMSYTTFEQSIKNVDDRGDSVNVTVEIKNTGDRDGKEVVQIYYEAPYTDFDKTNKIEKAVKNLVAFDKVEVKANKTETVTLSFAKEDMASYCYTRDNGDGTKGCYVLEEGEYILTLGKNSHDAWDSATTTIADTVWYDNSNPRQSEKDSQSALDAQGDPLNYPAATEADKDAKYVAATNLFSDCSDYMHRQSRVTSRRDWQGSQPVAPANGVRSADDTTKSLFGIEQSFNHETDKNFGNVEGSVVYAAEKPVYQDNKLTLSSLRGLSYYDSTWDELIAQIEWTEEATKEIVLNLIGANYTTLPIKQVGLEATDDNDGVQGIKVAGKTDSDMKRTVSMPYPPVMAATWNLDLIYEIGKTIGQEALHHNITGWYAPAINLHRSPFCGRVFEYYSEDPLISGKVAAAMISGAGDQGLTTFVKHFAGNEQEKNRKNFVHTWATEQTFRELYFRAFEIAVKEAKMTIKYTADENGTVGKKVIRACTGIMMAQNNIGGVVCHANYALMTGLLRNEWGFTGTVLSDMYNYWDRGSATGKEITNRMRDLMLRTGCDIIMAMQMPAMMEVNDYASPSAVNAYSRAVKNLCYTFVNSNLMQNVAPGSTIYYGMSPWAVLLLVGNIVVYLFVLAGIVLTVLRFRHSRRHPEQYKCKMKTANEQ